MTFISDQPHYVHSVGEKLGNHPIDFHWKYVYIWIRTT